ncbi:NAD(P)/FAD-dependent oxidoreductase [Paraburkholderia sp. ZP32-5]|uniref:NAD(P)/FAD-dependent oxidoreductase n=1 Tax=Paraburkholderia sp. ZP32-5 TaxID=2883245 RepID=UPI001F18CE6B|nr:FAD-binding oxidoreductase [Paraburkholderia sp. ZP32-5]
MLAETRVAPSRLPRSLYAETARAPVDAPALDANAQTQVVVIGAGFTGLSAALHLAQQGIAAIVVDANEPGWGASGRNGGQVNPGLKFEPAQIERDFGADLGARMVRLSGDAPSKVFGLIDRHRIDCNAQRTGTIRAAFSNESATVLREATAAWQARGAPVEALERDAIAHESGCHRYVFAALDRRGGSVNPLGYARGLAEVAQRAGARVCGDTPALSLTRSNDGWSVRTPRATITAQWVVLATNGYTDDLWPGLRRSIVPVFSGIAATAPLPPSIANRILPGRYVLYEHESITVYYRIDEAGRLLIGGRSQLRPIEGPDALTMLTRYALRLWPFLGDVTWTHGWNGQIAVTLDHYPHFHEPAPGLIAALGYNGRGVAMATAMGGEIARRIGGAPAHELDVPVLPIKPIPFHACWPIGAAARITYGRALGWIAGIKRGA